MNSSWTRMNILDSIIPKGWYFYRKRRIIFSKSRRDDIITNQEKMYLLKKKNLGRIDGIIISPILGSSFCYWIYSIIMTTLRVYIDKKGVGFSSSKKVWKFFTNNIAELHLTISQHVDYPIFGNILIRDYLNFNTTNS